MVHNNQYSCYNNVTGDEFVFSLCVCRGTVLIVTHLVDTLLHTAHFLEICGNSILAFLALKPSPPGGGGVSPKISGNFWNLRKFSGNGSNFSARMGNVGFSRPQGAQKLCICWRLELTMQSKTFFQADFNCLQNGNANEIPTWLESTNEFCLPKSRLMISVFSCLFKERLFGFYDCDSSQSMSRISPVQIFTRLMAVSASQLV